MNFQEDIVKKIRNGNEEAFELVFRSLYAVLCTYANKYLKDRDQSEDVVQEVFFNYWSKRNQLEIQGALEAYLYRSVRNSCLNLLKHQNVRQVYQQDQELGLENERDLPNDVLVQLELEEKVAECLGKLPTERQKIFRLSREEELKYREISERLGISIKTVEAQMGKSLKSLRECLKDYLSIMIWFILLLFYYS